MLASFYALGASRNGWLFFGSLPGEGATDRAALIDAGLGVEDLEARGQLSVVELDLSVDPDAFVAPWAARADAALARGYDALWFARFPIDPSGEAVEAVLPFEAAWMAHFRGGRTVTLCPYIVGGLAEVDVVSRIATVGEVHEQVRRLADGELVPIAL